MTAIYLIRHGQASFGQADYDQLSEKGALQSQRLGQCWPSHAAPDKIFSGDLRRHQQTLENFLKAYQDDKACTVVHSGFNEFNHVELLSRFDSQWQNFADRAATINHQADQPVNAKKVFQREFSLALQRWISGQHDYDYSESWPQFKKRCISALQDVINQELSADNAFSNTSHNRQTSKNICVFTSGGTISVLVQSILGLSDENTLAISQQLRNTGVTKLLLSKNKLSIDYLNNYSHLTSAGADWVTFQ